MDLLRSLIALPRFHDLWGKVFVLAALLRIDENHEISRSDSLLRTSEYVYEKANGLTCSKFMTSRFSF